MALIEDFTDVEARSEKLLGRFSPLLTDKTVGNLSGSDWQTQLSTTGLNCRGLSID